MVKKAAAKDAAAGAPVSPVNPAVASDATVVVSVARVGKKGKRKAKVAVVTENNASVKKPKQDVAAAAAAVLRKEIEEKKAELDRLLEQVKSAGGGSDELKPDDVPKEPVAVPAKEMPVSADGNGSVMVIKTKDNSNADSKSTEEEEPVAAPAKEVPVSADSNGSFLVIESKDNSNVDSKSPEEEEPVAAPMKEAPVSADGNGSVLVIETKDTSNAESKSTEEEKPIVTNGSTPAADMNVVAEVSDGEDDSDGGSSDIHNDKDVPTNTLGKAVARSKILFAGNLSFKADEVDVRDFFGSAFQIVDVRMGYDQDVNKRGYGHVEFASEAEALKALEFNGKELLGRAVRLDIANNRKQGTPKVGFSKEANTVFVKGFDTANGEDELRRILKEHFGKCGEIERVSIPLEMGTGAPKGIAYIDFKDNEMTQKALALDNSEVGGFKLTVDAAKPRSQRGGRGRSGDSFGSGGRNSGGRGAGDRRRFD